MVDYHTTVNRPHPRLVHHYTSVTIPSPPLTGILLYIAVSVAYLRCDIGGIVIVEYLPQGG